MINYIFSFIAVVKAGNFSLAAKQISVSKAQLSRHVARLEQILGIQLLHRTTRSLKLTEHGKQFYDVIHRIDEQYQEAILSLKQDFSAIKGTLRITAPIDFGIEFLPDIIHQFTNNYPNINLIVSLSNKNEDLLVNNYDLAIRIANQLSDSSLRMKTLIKFKRLIVASPAYLKKTKTIPAQPNELKNHLCITSINHNASIIKPQWQFYRNDRMINYSLDQVIEVDSLLAQLSLIKLGTGIGRMPDYFICNELATGQLIELLPNIQKPFSYVYLLYPDMKLLPIKTRLFIDCLTASFSK